MLRMNYPTKKRWLEEWWKKNINIFLYSLENEEISKTITEFRDRFCGGKTSTDPKKLEIIIKRLFLKDVENRPRSEHAVFKDLKVVREGDEYYSYAISPDGKQNKWHIGNPFHIFDGELLGARGKPELINRLANIHQGENTWLFEQRFFINEHFSAYPTSHHLITLLHNLTLLKYIHYHIINRLRVDYFVFWPMYFYYILTGNIDFVLNYTIPLMRPVQLFLVRDPHTDYEFLSIKLFGDCSFHEIYNFIEDNKKNFIELNKLMGNRTVSARSLDDYEYYKRRTKQEDLINLASERAGKKDGNSQTKTGKSYEEIVRENAIRSLSNLGGNKKKTAKKIFPKELNRIKVAVSTVKKEINEMTNDINLKDWKKIHTLIDKINKFSF